MKWTYISEKEPDFENDYIVSITRGYGNETEVAVCYWNGSRWIDEGGFYEDGVYAYMELPEAAELPGSF